VRHAGAHHHAWPRVDRRVPELPSKNRASVKRRTSRRGDGNADRRYVGDALRGREVQ